MEAFKLTGKVALITGGASGLGLATVKLFLEAGAAGVTIVDWRPEALDEAKAFLLSVDKLYASRILTVQADVSKKEDTIRYVKETVAKFGKLDIAVANAGVPAPLKSIIETDVDSFDKAHAVNSRGVFLTLKYSALEMKHGGSLIVTSSQLGLEGSELNTAYTSSKFSARGMALTAAIDLAPQKIRVNVVCPGPIHTNMTRSPFYADREDFINKRTPLGRMGEDYELAPAYLYFASDASTYATGSVLKVDGGYSRFG